MPKAVLKAHTHAHAYTHRISLSLSSKFFASSGGLWWCKQALDYGAKLGHMMADRFENVLGGLCPNVLCPARHQAGTNLLCLHNFFSPVIPSMASVGIFIGINDPSPSFRCPDDARAMRDLLVEKGIVDGAHATMLEDPTRPALLSALAAAAATATKQLVFFSPDTEPARVAWYWGPARLCLGRISRARYPR